jgi:hypothetical protein
VRKTLPAFAAALAAVGLIMPTRLVAQSDLDALMKTVLAHRDENWKKLQQYILDEQDRIDVRGPSQAPIWGEKRDFTWFIRDGYFVKSPLKVNGVTVSETDRQQFETDFLKRAKARDRRAVRADAAREGDAGREGGAGAAGGEQTESVAPEVPKDFDAMLRQSRQPGFIESAYFLRFKFEQGKYALVGRETFDGKDVLRVEYYPARLFSHETDKQQRRAAEEKPPNKEDDLDAAIERMMNKVSLVTLWIDPTSSQIVKYTFDNVSLDFLPAAWLVRVNDLKASMTMTQPFPDVWLPHDVDMFFSAMLAIGTFDMRYHLDYHDYRQATTSGRIKAPVEH